jgi:hypothetical protein
MSAMFTQAPSDAYTKKWVYGVSSTGTFIKNSNATWTTTGVNGVPTNWSVVNQEYTDFRPTPLTFTAEQANSTIKLSKVGSPPNVNLTYSTDGTHWNTYTVEDVITLSNIGDKVMFRGSNNTFSTPMMHYHKFVMTGRISASGDVTSMLNNRGGNIFGGNIYSGVMLYMFSGCTSLTTAPNLPSTALGTYCYSYMFQGCTSLTTPPELPATTLANFCYYEMFSGCSSLTTTPTLPATTLNGNCYNGMFRGCTALTQAPLLPATTLAVGCYTNMFRGCTALTTAPALPATTLVNGCYNSMFYGCTALTTTPELPVTTLKSGCYAYMFCGCTSLKVAPELPANGLVYCCYEYMFQNCRSLKYIKAMFKTDPEDDTYSVKWVYGVSPKGTFVANVDASWPPLHSDLAIPYGWDVKYAESPSLEGISIWVDDFPEDRPEIYEDYGYQSWHEYFADYVTDPDSFGGNKYTYLGYSFNYDGDDYYIWEGQETDHGSYQHSYALTSTIDYDELYDMSIEADYDNRQTPIVAILDSDMDVQYDGDLSNSFTLVKVEE